MVLMGGMLPRLQSLGRRHYSGTHPPAGVPKPACGSCRCATHHQKRGLPALRVPYSRASLDTKEGREMQQSPQRETRRFGLGVLMTLLSAAAAAQTDASAAL